RSGIAIPVAPGAAHLTPYRCWNRMQSRTGLILENIKICLVGRQLLAIHAQVRPGEVLTVMGPSGSGKSTLLAYLGGFMDPAFEAEGRVLLDGKDLTALPAENRHAGVLFQDPLLFPHFSVEGNLTFAIPQQIRD